MAYQVCYLEGGFLVVVVCHDDKSKTRFREFMLRFGQYLVEAYGPSFQVVAEVNTPQWQPLLRGSEIGIYCPLGDAAVNALIEALPTIKTIRTQGKEGDYNFKTEASAHLITHLRKLSAKVTFVDSKSTRIQFPRDVFAGYRHPAVKTMAGEFVRMLKYRLVGIAPPYEKDGKQWLRSLLYKCGGTNYKFLEPILDKFISVVSPEVVRAVDASSPVGPVTEEVNRNLKRIVELFSTAYHYPLEDGLPNMGGLGALRVREDAEPTLVAALEDVLGAKTTYLYDYIAYAMSLPDYNPAHPGAHLQIAITHLDKALCKESCAGIPCAIGHDLVGGRSASVATGQATEARKEGGARAT
jgi:hypothetical protein